jgi:hypothetical protein
MKVPPGDRTRVWRSLQLILILLTFCLDFGHGIALGEHDIAFHPIYRLRQTLAIAISRMHQPPARGYLAYQSVVDALSENGFAFFPEDKGPHLDVEGWNALFKDTTRLDRALQQAGDTPIDHSLPPQIMRGNELGYVDHIFLAFRLFGLHIVSLYYFYFLLLGISCVLFVAEFSGSSFALFLLSAYLAGLLFLQSYAQSQGDQLATLTNSRLFDALSLLPAAHVFLLIWRKIPPSASSVFLATGQAMLLVFLAGCRTTAMWQIAMIVAAAIPVLWVGRRSWTSWNERLSAAWPATITIGLLATQITFIHFKADVRYREERESHLIWHEILRGILSSNLELQRIYIGKVGVLGDDTDQIAYDAVIKDLNDRHDTSSGITFIQNGLIYIDLTKSNSEYDRLARLVALRIIFTHPLEVIGSIPEKLSEQIGWFRMHRAMSVSNLLGGMVLAGLAGVLWLAAAGWRVLKSDLLSGAAAGTLVLACSLAPPLIAPSNLSVGTLLCFLVVPVVGGFILVALAKKAAEDVSTFFLRNQRRPAEGAHVS